MITDSKEQPSILQGLVNAQQPVGMEEVYAAVSLDLARRLRMIVGGIENGTLPADALAAVAGLPVTAFLQAFNGATWDQVRAATPADALATLEGLATTAQLMGYNGATWDRLRAALPADALATLKGLATTAQLMGYNGATWDRLRTASVFKTVSANLAGPTVVWTPAVLSFRLMKYKIDVTAEAILALAGDLVLQFYDAGAAMPIAETIFVPAVAAGGMGSWSSGWVDLDNGILSAAALNALNINLSVALAGGFARVTVAGTEE